MTTLQRFIPTGYVEYKPEIGDYPQDLFACYVNFEKLSAIFYIGKQSKPAWYNRFNDIDSLKKKINTSISNLMSWEDAKKERKEKKKTEILDIKVGDLFVSSWGYEQTNVDFYQCIDVKGKTFTIRPIACKTVEDSTMSHGMADNVVPVKDAFLEDLERYPILKKRSLKISDYQWLSKTTETQSHYRSWYA